MAIALALDPSRHGGIAGDTITPVLNAKQAAEFLGVTPIWVRKLAAAGRIKADKVGGRDWIFKQAELERFAKIPRDVGPPTKAERRRYQRLRAKS
jgi:excisionase family DNA binding protein